jgi:hypothetical protein
MRPLLTVLALPIALASLARPALAGPAAVPGVIAEPAVTRLRALPSPAGPGSMTPHLSRSRDGEVWMSWLEPRARGGHVLRVARLMGHRWSTPLIAAEGDSFFVNWADRPGVTALGEGCLAAHWLWKTSPEIYSYDIRIAFSGDKGRTWSYPVCPHRDATATEHGFVSLLPEADGVRAVWLDGRNSAAAREKQGAVAGGSHGDHEVDADMTVRTALVHLDGTLADEDALDGRACDCCPTAAVKTMSGMLVAYRDRSPDEVRDIALVRRALLAEVDVSHAQWSEPYRLHEDGWKIPGCPVNGPALAADDDLVTAAWYTEAADSARVQMAFSRDGGRNFGEPIQVDDGEPLGRVDVVLLEDRSALVLWLESRGKNAEILVRRVSPHDACSAAFKIAETSQRRASGYPRMVHDEQRVIFAWTEAGNPSRVRVAEAMASGR